MGYTAIIDYGVGNLKSVANAMAYLGLETRVTGDAGEVERADAVILPGVGAFPDAADRLRRTGLDRVVKAQAGRKPILGICLGMQLLLEESDEVRPTPGLGLIPGRVERIPTQLKLPHIGWNSLTFPNPCPLFQGLEEGAWVYFVHSYCAVPARPEQVAAATDYGVPVTAAVCSGTVFGCQFHPEKSGETGLQILRNFGGLNR